MQQTQDRAVSPDERRAESRYKAIEHSVAGYPDLSDAELADVLHWFRKEATALDTAMLASNEAIAGPYRRLRADHLDRLSTTEKAVACLVSALVLGGIAALVVLL